mmetsp:Transcript_70355/g.139517  ORF Transcript_70355/g.139517 Transcript_70355/m.139517 type:complete len:232 (-) Transcript_70355:213-908(-)
MPGLGLGDQWLKDFDKAKKAAVQLDKEVQGGALAEKKQDARQAALLRGNIAKLKQDVSHLEKSIMTISQNTQAYGVTRKELSSRGDMLAELSEQLEGIQEAVRTGVRRRLDASEPPWRERDARSKDTADTLKPGQSLAVLGDQEMTHQDEALDFLHGTVQNLRGMGGDISQEIDLHCRLLGEAEDQTDSLTGKAKKQRGHLALLSEQTTPCYLWLYIACMLVVLFVLLVFF